MARKQLLRVHDVHTTFSLRAHSVLTVTIAFKIFLLIFYILSNPFANIVIHIVKMFEVKQNLQHI